MSTPRVEIDLDKIEQNTRLLVDRLATRGISVTGVTKAVCGHPGVAQAMLAGGAVGLADARVANVRRLRDAGLSCPILMIRAPMQDEIEDAVACCDISYNTEIDTILALAAAARQQRKVHGIILMIEMGDMRDGIMPQNLGDVASRVIAMPGVALKGIAGNFACLGNVAPTPDDMALLSTLANDVEGGYGPYVETVSAGSSVNLPWALGENAKGRVNNLRLGEAILLGREPITGQPIAGLYTDAFTLVAEVIETGSKSQTGLRQLIVPAPGEPAIDHTTRSVLAIGQQDTDTSGLRFPLGMTFIGATSDHTVIGSAKHGVALGGGMNIAMNYSALMRAMNAPGVTKVLRDNVPWSATSKDHGPRPQLTLI